MITVARSLESVALKFVVLGQSRTQGQGVKVIIKESYERTPESVKGSKGEILMLCPAQWPSLDLMEGTRWRLR